ncbi:hypothetical protein GCK32_019276 [Trichostrongylus colubriformis]|uniref:Uncharacterized protein n=1 Tax=Trichostrongylus colubriformis TaxID=6319 RepID=A0AAN8ES29_TRICO
MLPLFLIGIMAAICFANIPPEPVGEWNGSARYELAADFSLPSPDINATVFSCLREAGFKIVFLPVYNAYKSPYWILNAILNIPLAIQGQWLPRLIFR